MEGMVSIDFLTAYGIIIEKIASDEIPEVKMELMELKETLASVCLNGEYYPICQGVTSVGGLKIHLELENKADHFYSWVVYLENDSEERSPVITNFYGLDTTFMLDGAVKFNTLRGDDCSVYSFYPESFALDAGTVITRSPVGARSSDTTAFPYFDVVDAEGKGLVCGIGWSGQWKLDVMRSGDEVRILAGFRDCDFYLEPHEKVRSVRVLLCTGSGGEDALRHRFVRLHREHYSPIPSIDEDTYFPVSAMCFDRYYWGNIPKEGEVNFFETEEAQLQIIDKAAQCRKFNSYWLDACWFDGAFRTGVGNYRYAEGFPQGLRHLSEQARKNGMNFILWFEPVRAMKGTDIYNRFKSEEGKLLTHPKFDYYLVNLGDPEVWQYQFENMSRIIAENGIKVYRQDFNLTPYDFLSQIETEGRVGIAQIRFVEGIYRLWDALRERFPDLLIDNCASGGRLIDVETNMRAIPLWRSDMSCRPSPLGSQNEILGLSRYIPYHQGGTFDYTPYFLRSSMTTGIACEFGFLSNIIDPEKEKTSLTRISIGAHQVSEIVNLGVTDPSVVEELMEETISLREYWKGDFMPLTPPSDDKKSIVAYALHLPEEKRGAVLVFRREDAADSFTVRLSAVSPDREYRLRLSDEDFTKTEMTVTGKQLSEGLPVHFAKAPASLYIAYEEK